MSIPQGNLFRGDMFRIGDDSALAADVAEHGCRWFAFIGGRGCDHCGRSIREHEGDLRTGPAADMFGGDWVGMPFAWSSLPDRSADEWLAHITGEAE